MMLLHGTESAQKTEGKTEKRRANGEKREEEDEDDEEDDVREKYLLFSRTG